MVLLTNAAPLPMEEALLSQARVPTESTMSMCWEALAQMALPSKGGAGEALYGADAGEAVGDEPAVGGVAGVAGDRCSPAHALVPVLAAKLRRPGRLWAIGSRSRLVTMCRMGLR